MFKTLKSSLLQLRRNHHSEGSLVSYGRGSGALEQFKHRNRFHFM